MSAKNPYANLKLDTPEESDVVDIQSEWVVTPDNYEKVIIYTSVLREGLWVFGYQVFWADGRSSSQRPTAALGVFASQRDAKLYAIGFMLCYLEYFNEESRAALKAAEKLLSQLTLFV